MANLGRGAVGVLGADLLAERSDAQLIDGAVRVCAAHRFAERVVALEVVWALLVVHAGNGLLAAADHSIRIGAERGLASTESSLVNDLTLCIGSASGSVAGISALIGNTGQGGGTVTLLAATH